MTAGRTLSLPGLAIAAATLALTGCALDGGSSGTGITTAQGNVASAQTARLPAASPPRWLARLGDFFRWEGIATARSAVEAIHVSIEGTEFTATTDTNGFFAVRGDFAGPIGMRLDRADDGLSVRLVIVVPNGGLLTLSNVRINGTTVTVESQRVEFDGVVSATDCPRNTAEVVSRRRPEDGHRYTLLLGSTSLRDANGAPVACSALAGGQTVRVNGGVRDDGRVEADDVEVRNEGSGSGHGGRGSGDDGGSGGDDGGSSGSGSGSGGSDSGGSDSGSGSDDSEPASDS